MRHYKPKPKGVLPLPEEDPNHVHPKINRKRWHIPNRKPKRKPLGPFVPLLKKIPHPGIHLLDHYINEHGLTMHKLSYKIGVPSSRLASIVYGERSITVDTAIRLGIFYGVSPHDWLKDQAVYDIEQAWKKNKLQYDQIVPFKPEDMPKY